MRTKIYSEKNEETRTNAPKKNRDYRETNRITQCVECGAIAQCLCVSNAIEFNWSNYYLAKYLLVSEPGGLDG
jgi:hypothetical protein